MAKSLWETHGSPAGLPLGHRLVMLEEAARARDRRALAEFSTEEVWMLLRAAGKWDEGIELDVQFLRDAGYDLVRPPMSFEDGERDLSYELERIFRPDRHESFDPYDRVERVDELDELR